MAEKPINVVVLWVEGEIPEDYDWSAVLPDGIQIAEGDCGGKAMKVKTFPFGNVHHEVNWWITRPLTFDEWIRLDDAESRVLGEILGDDFIGTAGPIPESSKASATERDDE